MMNRSNKEVFIFGLLATLAMSAFMGLGMFTGVAPMPAPIPVALVKTTLGSLAKPVLIILSLTLHFLYGGVAAVVFIRLFRNRLTLWTGFLWGVILWVLMQVIFLPYLGWGVFGTNITPKIAVATLILHLIYGGTLGWQLTRSKGIGAANKESGPGMTDLMDSTGEAHD